MAAGRAPLAPTYEEVIWERTTECRMSTVISLLPVSLQSRMAPFKSFRRTASLGNLKAAEHLVCTSAAPTEKQLSPSTLSITGGSETSLCRDGTSDMTSMSDGTEGFSSGMATPMRGAVTPLSSVSGSTGASTPSGIKWKMANQGSSLINIAAEAGAEGQAADLERRAFVDGLTYLLRGLPSDLDVYETEQIRSALPTQIGAAVVKNQPSAESSKGTRPLLADNRHTVSRSGASHVQHHNDQRSMIHRTVQLLVVNLFVLVHLALPYAILLLKAVASAERRYKVSETVVGHSINLAGSAGRRCSQLAGAVMGMNEGRVGRGLSRAVAWTVEEVTRGVSDGVGEGLVATRLK